MGKGKSKGKNQNRTLYIVLGGVAVAIVILAIVGTSLNKKSGSSLPSVLTTEIKTGEVAEKVDTSGMVESQNKKTFFSPVNATIEKLNFQAGDSVISGETLISFNLEDLEEQNQKAELTALAGRYGYKDSLNKSNKAVSDKNEAAAQVDVLQKQVDDYEQYIRDLNEAIANESQWAAQNAQAQAQALADRQNALMRRNTEIQKEILDKTKYVEDLSAALQAAGISGETGEAEKTTQSQNTPASTLPAEEITRLMEELNRTKAELLELNKQQLDLQAEQSMLSSGEGAAGEGSQGAASTDLQLELQEAQADLAEVQSELASKKAIAENDPASLSAEAKAQMEVNNNLQDLEAKSIEELIEEGRQGISAEFSGVITNSELADGATVTQGMQLFTLQSTEDVCVKITLSKYDFDKVKEGQKATVTIAGNEYSGTVTGISKIASVNEKGTPIINGTVKIDNPDENIFLGVDAKVSIDADKASNVPLISIELVNADKDGSFCYVVEDGVVAKRRITTGVASDSFMEVTQGLKAGDRVITDIGQLEEGAKVSEKNEEVREDAQDAAGDAEMIKE